MGIAKNGTWVTVPNALQILQNTPNQVAGPEVSIQIPDLNTLCPDVVFPVLHGPFGEDGRLQ